LIPKLLFSMEIFISIKLKPFMAHKSSIRFDLKLKWVYEFSISWVLHMNESNVSPYLNYLKYACWNKAFKWLSFSFSIIILWRITQITIIYKDFGWLQSELVKPRNIFQHLSSHLLVFLQNAIFFHLLAHVCCTQNKITMDKFHLLKDSDGDMLLHSQ
jgi:hypothetical protein